MTRRSNAGIRREPLALFAICAFALAAVLPACIATLACTMPCCADHANHEARCSSAVDEEFAICESVALKLDNPAASTPHLFMTPSAAWVAEASAARPPAACRGDVARGTPQRLHVLLGVFRI